MENYRYLGFVDYGDFQVETVWSIPNLTGLFFNSQQKLGLFRNNTWEDSGS